MNIEQKIRSVKDYPKEGIDFKDITTLLKDKDAFKYSIDEIAKYLKDKNVDLVVGPEARGFIMGTPVAYAINAGFVPVRKPGKLPADVESFEYDLEYGTDTLEIHKDAILEGQRVAIVDDLLATGGTTRATAKLIEKLGGKVVAMAFLIELEFLNGRDKVSEYDIKSLVKY
ncbi:MAG: adenine phosphoribosyltransferase [Peptostreptococcaceae bacterium]|jgi:adenine phosphoribosyltransferase|nr:adenine phosphoribosyltransferase [Peptostreptococcaceae bacterium]